MDREGLTSAFASLCLNVIHVYRWVLGGICPPPIDVGTDRTAIEMSFVTPQTQRRSVMTMTDFDSTDRRSTVDQSVTPLYLHPPPPHHQHPPPPGDTKPPSKPRMPMLQTYERGQKYQLKLQEKIKTWQTLAAKQRVFKATPLPKQYKYTKARNTSNGDAAAAGSGRRSLPDEKTKIEAEKKQLSVDMLLLLNALAKSHKQIAPQVVPVRRSNDITDPQYEGFSAHTKLRASIDDVAGFFELDTPHKAQAYARIMGEIVLDKRRLYTLVERPISDRESQPLHFVSVEWLMLKMPLGFNTRDVCYLESSDSGVLDYYRVAFGKANGTMVKHVSKALADRHLKHATAMALNLEEYFISQRVRPMLDVPVGHFQSKKAVEYCMHCYNRIAWHATKRQCRGCGDVACARCSCVWYLPLDQKKTTKVQLCHGCITGDMDRNKRRYTHHHPPPPPPSPRQSMYSDDNQSTFAEPNNDRPSVASSIHPSIAVSSLHPHSQRYSLPQRAHSSSCVVSLVGSEYPRSSFSMDTDQATELYVLSPSQWRVSEDVSSAIRDGMLTFHSDASAIYLRR
ncbi:hypothetical protein DYB36_006380 [Aphanomyces astaci]|uniref:FYVE-type domain-containing protein n=1 Tax=Aphanomyces astaci TaxID=112090 RepID=A0A397AEW5_APHAT|nr:hypothetical protein DYB36_006380 [Aphanomyces astaci]